MPKRHFLRGRNVVTNAETALVTTKSTFCKIAKNVSNAVSALVTTFFAENYWKCVNIKKKKISLPMNYVGNFFCCQIKKVFLSKIFYIHSTQNFIYYWILNKINVVWTETCIKIQIFQKGYHLWHVYWIYIIKITHAINNIMLDKPLLLKSSKVSQRLQIDRTKLIR